MKLAEELIHGEIIIRIDPRYFRPTEVDELLGDSTKARKKNLIGNLRFRYKN